MSEANTRTVKELKQDFATFQLMFSVQKFVVEQVLSKAEDEDFKLLGERSEIFVPIEDEEVIVSLNVIEREVGDFVSLVSSLNQLGEDLNISFNISRNDSNEYAGLNPIDHPFILSVSAFPEEHYNEEAEFYAEAIKFKEIDTIDKTRIIESTKWQEESSSWN